MQQVPARTDWATPWPLFLQYDAEFAFTLDVCAQPENTKCRHFVTDLSSLALPEHRSRK